MKQRILVAAVSVLLSALILLLLPGPSPADKPAGPSTPTGTATGPGTTGSHTTFPTVPQGPGVVTLYTCDPALYQVYTELAAEYAARTDTQVYVLEPGTGSCQETLAQYLESENPPTIFCLHSQADVDRFRDRLYDLTGSFIAQQLYSEEFALHIDGKILGVAADTEGFGLIYNASLLGRAGYSRTDITDYAALENLVKHISANRSELGFDSFGKMDFSNVAHEGLACLLSMLYADVVELRSFVDLYSSGAAKSGDALEQFLTQKTVFYLGSNEDYDKVAQLGVPNLDILPAYGPNGGSLQYVCDHYWALNGTAASADIAGSLRFMRWLVTASQENAAPVDRLGLLSPYQGAAYYHDNLDKKLREYMATETVQVSWERCVNVAQEDLEALSRALTDYIEHPTDENWLTVAQLLLKKAN